MTESPTFVAALISVTAHIFMLDFGRYFIAAMLVSGAVWLLRQTRFASRKIQRREATRKDFMREFSSSIRTVLVYLTVTVPMVWGFKYGVFQEYEGPVTALTFMGYLALILVVHDAYFYWSHRAMHLPALYRTFHRHHHLTITPTAWTAYSFDVAEAFVMVLFMPIFLFLIPTPQPVLFTFLAIMILRNAMGHAGLELHPRGWASHPVLKWISTTTHHDMHHGTSYNHNYGFYFTWWDKLMGTEHPDYVARFDAVTAPERGVADQRLTTSASPQTTA